MPNHDIMIIGTSAGGLEASIAIISQLPAEFPAALFVVMHMSPEERSLLPNILSVRGALPPSTLPRAWQLSRDGSTAPIPITTCRSSLGISTRCAG